jgi:hypothetical protein
MMARKSARSIISINQQTEIRNSPGAGIIRNLQY